MEKEDSFLVKVDGKLGFIYGDNFEHAKALFQMSRWMCGQSEAKEIEMVDVD
jgi:hypothetical protein